MAKKFLKIVSVLSLVTLLFTFGSLTALGADGSGSDMTVGYAFGEIHYRGNFGDTASTSARAVPESSTYKGMKLYVGGMPFGVKFLTEGVIVAGFNDNAFGGGKNPAREAGLAVNDMILRIDGAKITGAAELNEKIGGCNGKTMSVTCSREGREYTVSITPAFSEAEGRYSIGIYVRDSGAGIGTVTFIVPESRAFAGLGHGICDSTTGRLIPMQRGSVVGVKINGIVKGLSGSPGEVKGYFNSGKTGTLLGNTDCGVYGVLADLPKGIGEPVPVGLRDSVKEGKAYVYTQLDGDKVEKYEIEISDIQKDATGNKCYTVKITDKALISKTGGIIQGMSGSPIVQNGKLIGAVTHVLINDPTCGYGIFIENMLAQMGDLAS
ncbi:MAG: SpoIVB peptidase [Clostridia bacterium]|nr:SpoIVB peptidase [Clostridia bacterium]